MKKAALTIALSLFGIIVFSQTNRISERIKYVTIAPNGSVSFTIIDDAREYSLKLESVDAFYKYQILNIKTAETVYESKNEGKMCIIDKSKIAAGTYDIRLFTSNFIITSKITVSAYDKFKITTKNAVIAINN